MKTNITRFSDKVNDYVKYRPQYPRQIIKILEEKIGLTSTSVVADIGSGTGISSDLFIENGNKVYAVEPNRPMRLAAENAFLGNSSFVSIDGSAEKTGLVDNSIDVIFAGQAFHWFDRKASKLELNRILKSNGHIVLAWNERSERSDFQREYEQILQDNLPEYNQKTHKKITEDEIRDFLLPRSMYIESMDNSQMFNLEQVKGRFMSSSYVPNNGTLHDFLIQKIEKLFDKYQQNGFIKFEYITSVYYS